MEGKKTRNELYFLYNKDIDLRVLSRYIYYFCALHCSVIKDGDENSYRLTDKFLM